MDTPTFALDTAEEDEIFHFAPALVPLASACSFGKAKWTKDVVQYVLNPYPLRKQSSALPQLLQSLSETERKRVVKEAARVLYHCYSPPSNTTNWVDTPAPGKGVAKAVTPSLHVSSAAASLISIAVSFKDGGMWHYVADTSSYETFAGTCILPQDGEWAMTLSRSKGREVQSKYLTISFYDQFPSYRVFLLHFENRLGQRISIAVPVSFSPPPQPQLPFFNIAATQHRPVFPSMTKCIYKSVPFYRSVGTSGTRMASPSLAALYAHENLAKPIAHHRQPGSPFVGTLLETSGVSLSEWLRAPWPLVAGQYDNLIELSKLQVIAEIAGALASIHAKKMVHGVLCLDAIFINAEFSAKLLWNCEWTTEPPGLHNVERDPHEWKYTAPELIAGDKPSPISAQSDVYAFGLLMHEVLSGVTLRRNSDDIIQGKKPSLGHWMDLNSHFLSLPTSTQRFDLNYDTILSRCMEPDPLDRPKMSEVERALNAAFAQACGDFDLFTVNASSSSVYCRVNNESNWNEAISKLSQLKHLEYSASGAIDVPNTFSPSLQSLVLPNATSTSDKLIKNLPESLELLYAPRLGINSSSGDLPDSLKELWVEYIAPSSLSRKSKKSADVSNLSSSSTSTSKNQENTKETKETKTKNSEGTENTSVPSKSSTQEQTKTKPVVPPRPKLEKTANGTIITKISVATAGEEEQKKSGQGKLVLPLPSEIRVLSVSDLDVTDLHFDCMPKNLEALRAGALKAKSPLDAGILARSLTALSLPGVERFATSSTALPPQLTLLSLAQAKVDSAWLETLPQSLKWLDIRSAPNPPNDPGTWPPELEYLDISSAPVTAAHWAVLARRLDRLTTLKVRRLVLPSPHLKPPPPAPAPRTLTHFEWTDSQGGVPQALFTQILPPELRYLAFPNADFESGHHAIISALPPRLTTLIIPEVVQIVDTYIHLLPRGLTHLNLASATGLTDSGLKRVPRPLVHLDLKNCPLITDDLLPWLPDTITYLDASKSTNWKNTAMKYLPRNIKTLNLSSATLITQDCIPDLPPTLTNFTIPNAAINSYFETRDGN